MRQLGPILKSISLLILSITTFQVHSEPTSISYEIQEPSQKKPNYFFDTNPTGVSNAFAKGECQADIISNILLGANSLYNQAEGLRNYVKNCGDDITTTNGRYSPLPLLKLQFVHYHFADNPNIKSIKVTLPDGRSVTGVLALQNDTKPRPFIIVKCGVYCDITENSTIADSLLHLFDESPFHVLVLANITGADFSTRNQSIALGGFDEGEQIYQIAKYLKTESTFKNQISSVQVLGISLGGNGALFASLYNSLNPINSNNDKAIDATMALCPVVNLQSSMERLFQDNDYVTKGASYLTFSVFQKIFEHVPFFRKILSEVKSKTPAEAFEILKKSVLIYYKDWSVNNPMNLYPFKNEKINSLEDLWRLNNFSLYYDQVTTPTLLVSAMNDVIVRTEENSLLIKSDINPMIQTVAFPQGNHCAFSFANGFDRWSHLMRSYFISHDSVWKNKGHYVILDLTKYLYSGSFFKRITFPQYIVHTQFQWKIKEDDPFAILNLKYFDYAKNLENVTCLHADPFNSDDVAMEQNCFNEVKIKIPVVDIAKQLGFSIPQNNFEATRMMRVLNTRGTVVDADEENYIRSQKKPTQFKFLVY